MDLLLFRLAERLARDPFSPDNKGCYHLWIDGCSVFLEKLGEQLLIRSPLEWKTGMELDALLGVLIMVTQWARHYPQAVTMNSFGYLMLEARLDLASVEYQEFERVLEFQVSIFEWFARGKLTSRQLGKTSIWQS